MLKIKPSPGAGFAVRFMGHHEQKVFPYFFPLADLQVFTPYTA
jgi:hypothetical protein